MTAVTLIYLAVSLSALLSAGTLIAFFWCERRARTHERAMAKRLADLYGSSYTVDRTGGVELAAIPIKRRPFHEALEEDAPELAPSPRAVAISRELLAQRRSAICNATSSYEPEALPSQPRPSLSERAPALSTVHEDNDEMLKQEMAAAAVAFGALTACQPMKRAEYPLNPHPKERYELIVKIDGAPGAFKDVRGGMHYWVPDNSCVPPTGGPMNPIRFSPEATIPFPLEQLDATTYRAEVWTDGMVDRNYYGLGTCKWELVAATIILKGRSVTFAPDLWLRDLRAEKAKVLYFSDAIYSAHDLEGWPESGEQSSSNFSEKVRNDLFTITLTPRRVAP